MTDLDAIIDRMSEAQKLSLMEARLFGGPEDAKYRVRFVPGHLWPKGVAQYFTPVKDTLTALGEAVRSRIIERQSNDTLAQ